MNERTPHPMSYRAVFVICEPPEFVVRETPSNSRPPALCHLRYWSGRTRADRLHVDASRSRKPSSVSTYPWRPCPRRDGNGDLDDWAADLAQKASA